MLTLSLQLVAIFACCLGIGITFFPFIRRESSPLSKLLFTFTGGFFLIVLLPQNLVYVGVPVRISAWLMLGLAVFQFFRKRGELPKWAGILRTNPDMQTLIFVVIASVTFHSVVPIRQGLDSYYGKAHPDQLNYVLLAEFLKEEPYSTDMQDIGYKPWLLRPVRLKEERIGQSIVTAEISELALTNTKTGYAATYIFFLAALVLCLYVLLRDLGANHVVAGFGAFLAAILPAITRLTLDGFLSQTAVLFLFPFFACLLRRQEWNSWSFTLFFCLGLAYLISAYTEMAPFGAASFLLGVTFARRDPFRHKRLMILSAILIVALLNPFYIYNLIAFLSGQYFMASKGRFMDELVTNPLSLRGLSEVLFGTVDPGWTIFLQFCGVSFVLLAMGGFIALKRPDKIVLSCVLLPVIVAISLLAIRVPVPVYPIAKLIFSFSPFLCVLVSYAISRFGPANGDPLFGAARVLPMVLFLAVASFGSIKEYGAVADNTGLLASVRDPRFLDVCRSLESVKNKRVLLFEADRFLAAWLCYHARGADAYCDAQSIGDAATVNQSFAFSKVPRLDTLDLFVSRDRVVDTKSDAPSCLVLIDNPQGMDRENGRVAFWLGPPARFRFLAERAISANLKMKLAPGPDAKTTPVHFLIRYGQGSVAQGDVYDESTEVRRVDIPQGFSDFELIVSAERVQKQPGIRDLRIAKLNHLEISDLKLVTQ
jgi:hypothetical protein